jgi:hypothetical protein
MMGALLKHRTRQLRYEREKRLALEETNTVLAAYIASLVEELGGVRVSRAKIKEFIGKYNAKIASDGTDYVIGIERNGRIEGEPHGGK